jgi:hypothetical protein
MMTWTEWKNVDAWPSVAAVAPGAVALADDLFAIGGDTYLFAVPYDAKLRRGQPGAPFATMVVWAPSEGAARRVCRTEIEADADAVSKPPPPELLPAEGVVGYAAILKAARQRDANVGEVAAYRIATDGAFIHREITWGRSRFYFRDLKSRTDPPYAITLRFPRG